MSPALPPNRLAITSAISATVAACNRVPNGISTPNAPDHPHGVGEPVHLGKPEHLRNILNRDPAGQSPDRALEAMQQCFSRFPRGRRPCPRRMEVARIQGALLRKGCCLVVPTISHGVALLLRR